MKAKVNVDWVFSDKGAQATYAQHRSEGESCFQAVLSAQAHNRPVQKLLRACQGFVTNYLNKFGKCNGCTLANVPPGSQDCQCITIVPTGEFDETGTPFYRVTNNCPAAMKVSVTFVDAATDLPPSSGQPLLLCPPMSFLVRPPQWYVIPSISGYGIWTAAGFRSCVCHDNICN